MQHTHPTTTRRSAVAAIGTGIVGSLAGCVGSLGDSKLQQQLDTVRQATERYTDHTNALGDGFRILGPVVPGMGWHFSHPGRLRDAAENGVSLEKPPLLTYDRELNLGAVEWAVPAGAIEGTPDLFADDGTGPTEKWHTHESATHVLAVPDDEQTPPGDIAPERVLRNDHWAAFRPPDDDLEPGDTANLHWGSLEAKQPASKAERTVDLVQTVPDLLTLHAWVYADNPDGVFAPTNSEFAQAGGHGGDSHSH